MGKAKSYRIGLLHYSCPPIVGGVESLINQHAHVLMRLGHEITLFAGMGEKYSTDFKIVLEETLSSRDERILKANELSRSGNHQATRFLTESIFQFLTEKTAGLEVLLAHNVLQMPFNLPLTLALRRLGFSKDAPDIVSWAHDSPYVRPNPPAYLNTAPWNALRTRHPKMINVTVSNSRKMVLKKSLGDFDWHVVNNGIDPMRFFYLDEKTMQLASEVELFSRDLVAIMPARLTPRKNLELAIRVIHGIKSLGHDVLFLLSGAYDPHEPAAVDYYQKMHNLITELDLTENVIILAEHIFQDGTKLGTEPVLIQDLYHVADFLLMTSVDEGFGLPLLEAGMAKLPIACTDIAPFKEVGTDICFFRPTDPPMFIAGRIIEYLARTSTHKMYRRVISNYIWESICRQELLPLIDEAVGFNGRDRAKAGPDDERVAVILGQETEAFNPV